MISITSILKTVANSGEIEAALTGATSLVNDATSLKAAISNDLAELNAGTLTAGKIDTLQAAEKFLKDVGKVLGTVGELSGNPALATIGAALAAV